MRTNGERLNAIGWANIAQKVGMLVESPLLDSNWDDRYFTTAERTGPWDRLSSGEQAILKIAKMIDDIGYETSKIDAHTRAKIEHIVREEL